MVGPVDPLATLSLADLERMARDLLPGYALDYFDFGAGEGRTYRANAAAWRSWWFVPRVLRDMHAVSLATTVLGERIGLPVLVAPMASQQMAHPDGELATARATAAADSLMVVSFSSNVAIDDLATVPGFRGWLQLYPVSDPGLNVALIERAAAAGARAVVVTVECQEGPWTGRPRIFPAWLRYGHHPENLDSDLHVTWESLAWLRSQVSVPLVLKGILHPEDAAIAADEGYAAVIVSNHGGRTIDGMVPTAEMLPEVIDRVGDRLEVYVDGGIRSGGDVLRALALGARAVLVGRPFLWGLAIRGTEGASQVFNWLRDDLVNAMRYTGTTDLTAVDRSVVRASRLLPGFEMRPRP